MQGDHLTNASWSRWNSKATKTPKDLGMHAFPKYTCKSASKMNRDRRSKPVHQALFPSLSSFSLSWACTHTWPTPSTPLLRTLKRRGSFEMEVVPAGKPQSSFRSHHFRLLSLLLNNLGCYNKRIGIYMEFSLAKMQLKDAAIIMNNKTRCLPFFSLIAIPKEGKGEKRRGRKWCKIQRL